MGISRSTIQGIAVSLTVVAGMGLGMILLFLLYSNGYECPTLASSTEPGSAEAVRGWWPIGMSCVSDGARSDPGWGATTLVLIGLGCAICAIPFWVQFVRKR